MAIWNNCENGTMKEKYFCNSSYGDFDKFEEMYFTFSITFQKAGQ